MFGLSHGLVEGVINPLMATIYSDQKTKKIVAVHAWWPAGLIAGGLVTVALTQLFDAQLAAQAGDDSDSRGGVSAAGAVGTVSSNRARHLERFDAEMWKQTTRPLFLVLFRLHVDDGGRRDRAGPVVPDA